MEEQDSNLDRLLKARLEIDEELRRHKEPLTVLFTDVVGSTSFYDRYGDTAGFAMIQRHTDLAAKAVAEFRGRVIKTIGDSVMAEFPEPVLAVRAAVEMQRRLLQLNSGLPEREQTQLRIGINSGTGFRRENDVFGDAVNLAARITKHTGAAQIMISGRVREAIAGQPDLPCNPHGKVTLAGKAEKEDIFEVIWTDTETYTGLRQNLAPVSARGDLPSPGKLEEFLQPSAAKQPAPPVGQQGGGAFPPALTERYEILGEIGRGGMGIVCKARDRETGELVALKVLKPGIAEDASFMERFKRELRLARKITHKNVCRVHEFNRVGDTACISMEFVDGESLRAVLKRFGGMPLRKGIEIAGQICAGLREAHSQGVVHRDLKPENVMLDRAGQVKIMDFGIARSGEAGLTQAGAVLGTPGYMAPEQVEGKPVDQRADIYALGCILYEMLTGAVAFAGDTPVQVAIKQLHEAPRPPRELEPTLPDHIELAILNCLEKDPGKRFASVDEVEAALAGKRVMRKPVEGGDPQERTPSPPAPEEIEVVEAQPQARLSPPVRLSPAVRLSKAWWMALGGVLLGGVLLGGVALFLLGRASKQQASLPSGPRPQVETPAPAPAAEPAAAPKEPEAKAAKAVTEEAKPQPSARTVRLECEYRLKDGKLTISSGKEVVFQETLKGEKKAGFLRLKSSYFGSLSKSITIPPGARELTARLVSEGSKELTAKITAVPPKRSATLEVLAGRDQLKMSWQPKSQAR